MMLSKNIYFYLRQDVFLNLMRQALGAVFFLFLTAFLVRALDATSFKDYLLSWNAAQLITAFSGLGVYNGIVRYMSLYPTAGIVSCFFSLRYILLLQFLILPCAAYLGAKWFSIDFASVLIFSIFTSISTLLSAVVISIFSTKVFAVSELLQSFSFLVFAFLIRPSAPSDVALAWAFSVLFRFFVIFLILKKENKFYFCTVPPGQSSAYLFASKAYIHGLCTSLQVRMTPFLFSLIWADTFVTVAPVWGVFDRMSAVVQGVNQINYSKIISGNLTTRQNLYYGVFALVLFTLASFVGIFFIGFAGAFDQWVFFLTIFFVFLFQGAWHLALNFFVAKELFRRVFIGHAFVFCFLACSYFMRSDFYSSTVLGGIACLGGLVVLVFPGFNKSAVNK